MNLDFFNLDFFSNAWWMFPILGPVYVLLERLFPYKKYNPPKHFWEYVEDLSWELADTFFFMIWYPFTNYALILLTAFYFEHIHYALAGTLRNRLNLDINHFQLPTVQWSSPVLKFIIVFLVFDFVKYLMHRYFHVQKIFWKFHILHHSPEQLNCFSTSRAHFMEGVFFSIGLAPFIFFLNVDLNTMAWIVFIEFQITFFCHANINLNLGPLMKILNNPKAHHWHHAKNCLYSSGQNHGTVLLIWDRLFGTYYLPDDQSPPLEYGVSTENNYPENKFKRILYPILPKK